MTFFAQAAIQAGVGACCPWNYRNPLADGVELHGNTHRIWQQVVEMNRLGMIVDVSHLCDNFRDVLEITTMPVLSHSNARSVLIIFVTSLIHS